jgi:predicted transcriptional regulator
MAKTNQSKRNVLVSIRPIYATKILNGLKTVELRRRFPRATTCGAMAMIYSSSPVQAIVGFARIKEVLHLPVSGIWRDYGAAACIARDQFDEYFSGRNHGFAILLDDVRALRRQVKVVDMKKNFGIVPPQSFRYLDERHYSLLKDERVQIPC